MGETYANRKSTKLKNDSPADPAMPNKMRSLFIAGARRAARTTKSRPVKTNITMSIKLGIPRLEGGIARVPEAIKESKIIDMPTPAKAPVDLVLVSSLFFFLRIPLPPYLRMFHFILGPCL